MMDQVQNETQPEKITIWTLLFAMSASGSSYQADKLQVEAFHPQTKTVVVLVQDLQLLLLIPSYLQTRKTELYTGDSCQDR